MKLSDLCKITVLRHGRRVDLLDKDGTMLLSAAAATAEEAMSTLWEGIRCVFREKTIEPLLLMYRGDLFIVYFTPSDGCWAYASLNPRQEDEYACELRSTSGGYAGRKAAERAVRYHLAQRGWQPGEQDAPIIPAWDTESRRDFIRWAKWQNAYREAREQGKDDPAARVYADQAR
jgi:hypothetical protein